MLEAAAAGRAYRFIGFMATNVKGDKNIPNYWKLLRKTDLEQCFWANEYIHTGYRPPYLSTMHYVIWLAFIEFNSV